MTDAMLQAAERPFEGRAREMGSLIERWRLAREGSGQVVLVSAAAGVGKSRLIEALVDRTAQEERLALVCRCSKARRFTAFSPLVDLLRRLERVRNRHGAEHGPRGEGPADGTDPEDRLRATLVARLTALVTPAPLLTRSPRRRTTTLNLHPEGRAKRTLEEILGLFVGGAKRLPILLVVEDIEWADPSTLELLELLAHRRPHVRWMTVLTFEARFEAPFGDRANVVHLELPRLTRRQEEVLLDRLTTGQDLDPALRREIIARGDGVPLFLEEQVRLIRQMEAGEAAADNPGRTARQRRRSSRSANLPTILKHWLSARLDRLGTAKDLAQLAAVMGEELSHAQLAAVARLDAAELERALGRLVEAGILTRPAPVEDLAFSHSLIRDAIRASLGEKSRRQAHRRVVETLRESFAETAVREPELIAYHYGEAGMPAAAAASWRDAAERAVRSSANREAAECARRGLDSLDSVTGDQRHSLEIDLRIILGAALGTAKGFAADDAAAAYDRALELVSREPRAADHFSALQELASYYLTRGQMDTACEAADRALRGLGDSDPEILPDARRGLGLIKLLQGDFTGAHACLEKSLAPYAVHRSLLRATPPALGAPMAETLGHLSLAEWFLGRPSQALKHSTDSLTLARRFNDPYARVFTAFRASYLHVLRREPAATRELAHELVELANRHGFLFFIAAGMFLEGQALAAQGRAAEGLQMMSGGLDGVWASGMEVGRPRNLALLAEACGRSEHFEQGLSLIKEGLAAVELTGERHYEAELFRIQGELLRHSGASEEEIEDSFLQALGVARRQGTVALELRAAISLSRLRRGQGKPRRARELLAEVYGKFDEGFDTADLKDAKELLDPP